MGAHVEDGVHECLLHAGEGQVLDVAALARGADAEHAGQVPYGRHHDVGRAGEVDGLPDAGGVGFADRTAPHVVEVDAGQFVRAGAAMTAPLTRRRRAVEPEGGAAVMNR